jgi:hypothetical protein
MPAAGDTGPGNAPPSIAPEQEAPVHAGLRTNQAAPPRRSATRSQRLLLWMSSSGLGDAEFVEDQHCRGGAPAHRRPWRSPDSSGYALTVSADERKQRCWPGGKAPYAGTIAPIRGEAPAVLAGSALARARAVSLRGDSGDYSGVVGGPAARWCPVVWVGPVDPRGVGSGAGVSCQHYVNPGVKHRCVRVEQ